MPTERTLLAATAILAIGVPASAGAWVHARKADLESHLGEVGGVAARIGGADADLTGCVRLSDVAFGSLVQADAVEASIALDSLLAGRFGADEIRVAGPRVAVAVDATGDSDLARLVRRLAQRGGVGGGSGSRLRRVVVSSGSLVAHIAGLGEVEADDVELVPDAGGVRVITGPVRARGGTGDVHGELALARSAAEVTLPHVTIGRVLAVAGAGAISAGDRSVRLRDVAIGRLAPSGPLELRASLDDGGVERPIAAALVGAGAPGRIVLRGDRVPLRAFAGLLPRAIDVEDAHATGSLELAFARDGASLRVTVDGVLDRVRLVHHTLDEQPLELSAALRGAVTLAPDAIATEHVDLDVGAAHFTLSGWARRSRAAVQAAGQLDVALAPAPCSALLASLPADLRGPLDGMAMTGTFGGSAHVAIDLAAPLGDGVALRTDLANHCDVVTEPPAADAAALAAPGEQVFADGSRARIGKGMPSWTELARIPAHVPAAFVAAEDARFYEHHGFDPVQIGKSLEIDLRDRRLARGGSTISQQLVKNAFLTQRRTLDRKLQEAILTWRLEARLSKVTILERYLNIIELGPHVFGIGAAAMYWFGESAHELSAYQAAFLAALTSEPSTMSRRVRRAGGLDPESRAHVDVILRGMALAGAIDRATFDAAHDVPMRFAPTALRGEP